jgi:hypothetical protein
MKGLHLICRKKAERENGIDDKNKKVINRRRRKV